MRRPDPSARARVLRRARGLSMGAVLACGLVTSGCSLVLRRATADLADHLSAAVLDHDDPATVESGAPAFLLLLEGLIRADPENVPLLTAAARLYGTYASVFVQEPERAGRLASRGRRFGQRALCARDRELCGQLDAPFESFAASLARTSRADIDVVYGLGAAWATWISIHSDDWNAVADLPRVEALMARVIELDETFDDGGAHLYLGVLQSQRPAALGGRPEEGRRHFERADALASGRNLMVKVMLAQYYARLVFDRDLHDRLLNEVVGADAQIEGYALSNRLAQREAQRLLQGADDYF